MNADAAAPIEDGIRRYLAARMPAARELALTNMQRIAVGWSHETFLFDAHWQEGDETCSQGFCLRRDPGNALLRELSDLGEQFRVLQCLAATPLPTPRPFWYEADETILGRPFLVMEKVPGECPNPWGREGRAYYAAAAARGVLPASFTDTLATMHTLDWRAAGLDFLGVPAPGRDFALREIAKWRHFIEVTGAAVHPILADLMCWLEANAPSCARHCLVHGAYRTGNVLIDQERISAVLDWELQVIGDPMYDVAYVLSDLNREGTELLSNVVAREVFFERYEAATGITIDESVCHYYHLLYAMRSAAFWMSASALHASGASDDLRLARTAWSVPVVLERAARELGY